MSDDLDQLIRQAASAHLALAPARVLTTPGVSGVEDENDLIARAMRRAADPAYLAQLAPFDPEAVMMSEPDHDPPDDDDDVSGVPPRASATTDDSGLHDIRALAQTAKHRISRKIPAVTEADDGMWASSTGQLKAIALPEPARLIMLPDLPATADAELARATAAKIEARGAGLAATATDVTAIDAARPRKRAALWLGLGGVAAAAAVVIVVARGGSDGKVAARSGEESNTVAAGASPPPSIEAAALTATPGPGAADERMKAEGAVGAGSAVALPAAPGADDRGGATPTSGAPSAGSDSKRDRDAAKEPRGSGDGDAKPTKGSGTAGSGAGSGSGSATAKEPKLIADPKGGGDGKKPGAGSGSGSGSAAPTGEKSIDDLLGGGPKPPPPGGGDSGPKPDKKGLDGKDIKAGMAPLAGKAQGCFDQHGVAGHVKVKAIVDPSGQVTKVAAVGEFAGSPTGSCVASVVKSGASFPAWDGAPMTVNYSYTLNE